jgi:hypothetical protein
MHDCSWPQRSRKFDRQKLDLGRGQVRHSTVDMTANVYTHTSDESEREAALAIEQAIGGDLFPKSFPAGNKTSSAIVILIQR